MDVIKTEGGKQIPVGAISSRGRQSECSDLLCNLKSQVARNCIGDLLADLEAKICRHENGDWELIPEALADFQNDINILKKLGA